MLSAFKWVAVMNMSFRLLSRDNLHEFDFHFLSFLAVFYLSGEPLSLEEMTIK